MAAIAFVAAYGLSVTAVAIFACRPARAFYDESVKADYCIDDVSFYYAQAALNVATDVLVIALPIPVTWRLRLTVRKRLEIMLLFVLGGVYVWHVLFDSSTIPPRTLKGC